MKLLERENDIRAGKYYLLYEFNEYDKHYQVYIIKVGEVFSVDGFNVNAMNIDYDLLYTITQIPDKGVLKQLDDINGRAYPVKYMIERYTSYELTDDEVLMNIMIDNL